MPYIGAGGQKFQSSALARGSLGGTTTRMNTPAETAAWNTAHGISSSGSNVSPGATSAIQKAMAQYAPGGGYGKGIEADLERGRVKSVASGMQNLVSSGLANTTMAGGLGKKYEEEVAAPTRANMEETRASAIASLQAMLAQMEQGGFQAGLDRQFTADQSMLNRPQPSISSYSPPAYSAPAPRTSAPSLQPSVSAPRKRPSILDSATRAYSGGPQSAGQNWATINGQRWEQSAEGQWGAV